MSIYLPVACFGICRPYGVKVLYLCPRGANALYWHLSLRRYGLGAIDAQLRSTLVSLMGAADARLDSRTANKLRTVTPLPNN